MSFEKAKADLEEKGLGDHVMVLNESSATVAEAAAGAEGWVDVCEEPEGE